MRKTKTKGTQKRGEAQQVFRQFAWNIAGTLARPAKRAPNIRRGAAAK